MSFGIEDLGEIGSLAEALGLVDDTGEFQEDWLTRPGDYLSRVLADETQREALIAFIDDVLGGSDRKTDAAGRIWLPIVEETGPDVCFFAVLDDTPTDHVRIGVGVTVKTTAPDSETRLFVPLFKAAKTGHSVSDPLLLGQAGGRLGFTTEIIVEPGTPAPGAAHLGRIGLDLDAPTAAGDGDPSVSLTLGNLQLPGASAPRDLSLSLDTLDTLDDTVTDLVLGLIEAQARNLPGTPLAALAGLLGVTGGGAIPALPVANLASQGPRAIAVWFNQVISAVAARTAWYGELAALLGGGAAASADGVSFTLGAAQVTLGVQVVPGTGGASVITPVLSTRIASGDLRAEGRAELARIDLGDGQATALPQLSLLARAGRIAAGGTPLLTGDPAVDAVRIGIALNADRKAVVLLAADGVTLAGNTYDTLDLSSPDALAETAGALLGDVLDDLLDLLGPVGAALKSLLGLEVPAGHPGVPTLDISAFLANPLGAVGRHWRTLIRDHAAAVPDLLASLQALIADAAAAAAITGTGTPADPWRLPLIGPAALLFHKADGQDRLLIGLGCRYIVDTIGLRCTRVTTELAVGLADLDLAAPSAVFGGAVDVRLTARARGDTRARFAAGPVALSAEHVGLAARWTADGGLSVEALAPNPAAEFSGQTIPVALPTFAADGTPSLDTAGWDAVERLLGLLASQAQIPAFRDLVEALGWVPDSANLARDPADSSRPRLRLADLAATPQAALKDWAAALLLEQSGPLETALTVLTRQLTGSSGSLGRFGGMGRPERPYGIPLLADGLGPELACWLEPYGPLRPTLTDVDDMLRNWRPGDAGLDGSLLAEALDAEGYLDQALSTLADGRPDLSAGLSALVARWTGTDGRIAPPAADPPGVNVHAVADVAFDGLADAVDLEALLGSASAVRLHVEVVAADAALPWPSAPADRVIDLRAPGLSPESFAAPAAAAGEWFVALATREAARLATDDADGIPGQAARLARVLPAFAGLGSVAVVAKAGAGHAARRAAESVAAVTSLVTLGTPAGPVAFTILDTPPGAEALRVLAALLPAPDPTAPDDPDLARGRSLIAALTGLLPLGDPAVELRPPDVLPGSPRAGLDVHAVFGRMTSDAVRAGLTAVVAAGLSLRAGARAAVRTAAGRSGAGGGVRLPISIRGDGLEVRGDAIVEALGFDLTAPGGPVLRSDATLRLNLSFLRPGGWLLGGPDPARGPGPRLDHELRRIEANIALPLHGGGAASAEIVLIEPKVFGVGRDRWVVSAAGAASALAETVTPALPEVRVLLAQFATQLHAATDPAIASVKNLLAAIGITDATGGFVADGIDHLLNEPAVHFTDALADATRRAQLQTALDAVTGELSGLTLDLAARRLSLALGGVPGTAGLTPWNLTLEVGPGGPPRFAFELEATGTGPAGAFGFKCQSQPFAVSLTRRQPGSATPATVPLWPSPDADALLAALTRLAPAEFARYGLEYLRDLDEGARSVVEAVYDALGLLSATDTAGERFVRLPLALIEDPVAWLCHADVLGAADGFDAARIIALVDALKPILGVTGGPGEWQLASGITLRASDASGVPRLAVALDSSGFAPVPAAAGRLVFSGTVALALPAGLPPRPEVDVAVGVAGAASGHRAVHVATTGGLKVFVRPDSGPDLSLYPDPPGLGSLAEAAVGQALPLILDALADETGSDLPGDVGLAVRTLGDALALRSGASLAFDGAALTAWATDPAAAFAARLAALTPTDFGSLATALDPLLPGGVSVTHPDGVLTVTAGGVSVSLQNTPFQVGLAAALTGVPGVERVDLAVTLNGAGLAALVVDVGPADIDAAGVSLRPYFSVAAGNTPPGGGRVDVGLGLDGSGNRVVAGRWALSPSSFSLVSIDGVVVDSDPEAVALALVDAVLQLVAGFAMQTDAVDELLDTTLPGDTPKAVRQVLRGVFLEDVASPAALDPGLFDLDELLGRLRRLLINIADVSPSIELAGDLKVGISKVGNTVGLTLGLDGRVPLNPGSDVVISLEADSRWIQGGPAPGLFVGFLDATAPGLAFAPSLAANGIGLRIGRASAPLIDAGVTLGSVALHLFGKVSVGDLAGGAQIQLGELAVGVSGASGGNPVAQGIVADSGSGPDRLAPAFSPALAVQKHGSGPVLVSLRAGEGDGPWWLVIQKGFGPIYVEQVGFDTTVRQDQLIDISLLLDGRVSIAGLTAAVDDLRLTYAVASDASVFDPSKWQVDLAGLAVGADLAGVTLAGGLRKFGSGETVEYVGMLMARFATYGLSVIGGYGTGIDNGQKFAAFFAFGAINGPIGGPPAFFLTGIGGGVGINRDLIFPGELSRFGEFPFIKALDPAASVSSDPMGEMLILRDTFPMRRGDFWFAAGLSFTSFALVDGIAVVSVKVGDGLEIALLGLARLALPRPQVALVSIELGLLARMSTKEGVLWIQAELTENSWLLHESVRLTGGFAFVSWFAGPLAGEFVLTMGGYHPSFHRDGYPVVPRLGFSWQVSGAIVIKGENYFALTSEALMAGGQLEASARFGPAWAEVRFGANGIVYFDPFRFEVEVYARISAGITIDVWIGEITISISLGARIAVQGPKFRGKATFEVGPVKLSVAFGSTQQSEKVYLPWSTFVPKYLEDAGGGTARCITAIPGKGSLTPSPDAGGNDSGTADGSLDKPFEVFSEFEITVTTLVPTDHLKIGTAASVYHAPSRVLGLAPLGKSAVDSLLELHLRDTGGTDHLGKLDDTLRRADGFPVGVWGNPQADDDRKVPKGEVIEALEGVRFEAVASFEGTLPREMAYHQVESGPRKPLPFEQIRAARIQLMARAQAVAGLVPDVPSVAAMYATARPWLAKRGRGATALAVIDREQAAPPRLGSLTGDLADAEVDAPEIVLLEEIGRRPVDAAVRPPVAIAVLSAELAPEVPAPRTSVREPGPLLRVAPPRLADVEAAMDWAIPAKLVRVAPPAAKSAETIVARGGAPLSRGGQPGVAAVDRRGAAAAGKRRLEELTAGLQGRVEGSRNPATLAAGEIGVFCLPNAERDVDDSARRPRLRATGGPARMLALGPGGRILADTVVTRVGMTVARGTERVAVLATGARKDRTGIPGLTGWHDGQTLAYVGWSTALVAGGTVHAEGGSIPRGRQQFRAGWVNAAELTREVSLVKTRMAGPLGSIAIVIDDPEAGGAARELSLGLEGAERATDRSGRPVPPTLVVQGQRSILVYALRKRRVEDPGTVAVSVAREQGWRLAGVLGAVADAGTLAERLSGAGLDTVMQPLATGRGGAVRLGWVSPRRRTGGAQPIVEKTGARSPQGRKVAAASRSATKSNTGAIRRSAKMTSGAKRLAGKTMVVTPQAAEKKKAAPGGTVKSPAGPLASDRKKEGKKKTGGSGPARKKTAASPGATAKRKAPARVPVKETGASVPTSKKKASTRRGGSS